MNIFEILIISLSLSMDAFSASICKGLSNSKKKLKNYITIGLYFGLSQAIMPLIGFNLGSSFNNRIDNIDHYLSFLILVYLGYNLIRDSNNNISLNNNLSFKEMFPLSIATSIDALVIGVTFSFFKINLFLTISIIGIITMLICILGYSLGTYIGKSHQKKAQIIGGITLIIMGIKILIEHLF